MSDGNDITDKIYGATIKNVRDITDKELEDFGWHQGHGSGLVLELSTGITIIAAKDPEQNGLGELLFLED